MTRLWLPMIRCFFRAAVAGSTNDGCDAQAPVVCGRGRFWRELAKTLLWLVISVLVALAIGQLH